MPSMPARPATSSRWPGPGGHHDEPAAGAEHPGELCRVARREHHRDDVDGVVSDRQRLPHIADDVDGVRVQPGGPAERELRNIQADRSGAYPVLRQPVQQCPEVVPGPGSGVQHRPRTLRGVAGEGRGRPFRHGIGKGPVVAGGEEVEACRHHVGCVRFENGAFADEEVEVALFRRVEAVPGRAHQGTAGALSLNPRRFRQTGHSREEAEAAGILSILGRCRPGRAVTAELPAATRGRAAAGPDPPA